MAEPKPYQVARWISDDLQDTAFLPLRDVIEHVLRAHILGRSEEQIAELAEAIAPAVHYQLGVVADELRRNGIEPTFLVDDDPATAYIKAQHTETVIVLDRIRALSPVDFEHFCAQLLTALGGTAYHIGGSGDGGVDFIATNLPLSRADTAALAACSPLVVGQAKRYREDNLIGIGDLRSFLGAALIKADDLKRRDDRFGTYSPVAFAFWTTSNFNSPAKQFAARAGIWCLGGLALAQLAFILQLPMVDGL